MVYRHVSTDMKKRALYLLEEGWGLDAVLDALGVSDDSVRRWRRNEEEYGSVRSPVLPQGRPRILGTAVSIELDQLVRETPSIFLDEIMGYLAIMHGQSISIPTIQRNLVELGLHRKLIRKIASQRDEALRTSWLDHIIQNYTAEQMVFVDESSKDGRTIARRYGRAQRGETPEEIMSFKRGDRYSILAALALSGYIAVRVVEDSVDSEEMYDYVISDLRLSTRLMS
ncbi:hypothetical protein E1B28_003906 [Marasmius oreades]|uniref:Tc1-like transposase DDE domain-containing protein n=1 Tax=Marasmius oreades TaxID=181124 RepID=A0A9P7UXI3_9AGAR|nr:uncharacterized protein E1B28_003906 [Marasmius oreades]KAG7096475.1 hypothetical protein E1B28_003906 [Marasmius oreades]